MFELRNIGDRIAYGGLRTVGHTGTLGLESSNIWGEAALGEKRPLFRLMKICLKRGRLVESKIPNTQMMGKCQRTKDSLAFRLGSVKRKDDLSVYKISREPSSAAGQTYDPIIVGGGIYGAMLALEAARRGLRPLLLERGDFGNATSYHSLRIVHGGFRYLQTLDLRRFFESVGERRWFLQTFPELVKPLECLMPLYGNGARRPPVLYGALRLNDILSYDRNRGIRNDRHLPDGKVVGVEEVKALFPQVDARGLQGGAIWYDACMPDSQRLLVEVLRWACSLGATVLNYVEVRELLKADGRVAGVAVEDRQTGRSYEYRGKTAINAAGPWCREVATRFDRDIPDLFKSSIAWNVLFDRPTPSAAALAVAPKKPGASTYFLHPWKGRLLAGTVHDPWTDEITDTPMPSAERLTDFIEDLNWAVPGLNLTSSEVLRIFSGLLPASETGTAHLAKREAIFDHGESGGLRGLYSICGVKFTTSRLVAQKTLAKAFPHSQLVSTPKEECRVPPPEVGRRRGTFDYHWQPEAEDTAWEAELAETIALESVLHLDDLVLRRTSLGDNPRRALAMAPRICRLWGWDLDRTRLEIERLEQYYARRVADNCQLGDKTRS